MQNSPLASNYPQKSMRIGSTFYFCGLLKKVAACSIFAFCVGSARFNGGQISFGDNKLLLSAVLCTILGTTSCYLALELSAVRCTICARDVIVCLVLSAWGLPTCLQYLNRALLVPLGRVTLECFRTLQCWVCVLCWWVSDYLGLIGDNILGAGKNTDQGTPGKHRNTIQHKCKYQYTLQQKYSGTMPKEVVAIG